MLDSERGKGKRLYKSDLAYDIVEDMYATAQTKWLGGK